MINHIPELYHLTFGPHKPAMTLKDGDTVRVQIPDCDGLGPDGKPLSSSKFKKGRGAVQIANPTAGPYLIADANVGDSVSINIKHIEIDSDKGRTGISTKQIAIPQRLFVNEKDNDFNAIVPKKEFSWQIDRDNEVAVFCCANSRDQRLITVELNPFVGCIGVAPKNGQFLDGLSSGAFGGNIDIPGIARGCTITLPVFVEGAYIFLGDLHAAQGDGEIIGGAIEVSGTVTFQVSVNKGRTVSWPRMQTQDQMGGDGGPGRERASHRDHRQGFGRAL